MNSDVWRIRLRLMPNADEGDGLAKVSLGNGLAGQGQTLGLKWMV